MLMLSKLGYLYYQCRTNLTLMVNTCELFVWSVNKMKRQRSFFCVPGHTCPGNESCGGDISAVINGHLAAVSRNPSLIELFNEIMIEFDTIIMGEDNCTITAISEIYGGFLLGISRNPSLEDKLVRDTKNFTCWIKKWNSCACCDIMKSIGKVMGSYLEHFSRNPNMEEELNEIVTNYLNKGHACSPTEPFKFFVEPEISSTGGGIISILSTDIPEGTQINVIPGTIVPNTYVSGASYEVSCDLTHDIYFQIGSCDESFVSFQADEEWVPTFVSVDSTGFVVSGAPDGLPYNVSATVDGATVDLSPTQYFSSPSEFFFDIPQNNGELMVTFESSITGCSGTRVTSINTVIV